MVDDFLDDRRQDFLDEARQDRLDEARESVKDAMWVEFYQTYSTDDVLTDMIKEGDSEEMRELLGDYFEEHKEIMFEQYCEHR